MSAVRNVVLKLFHLLAAIHFIYAVYYEIVHILPEEIPLRGYSFGGKFVYLTILNVVSDAESRDLQCCTEHTHKVHSFVQLLLSLFKLRTTPPRS